MKLHLSLLAGLVAVTAITSAQEQTGKWKGNLESNFTIINGNRDSESFLLVGNAKSLKEKQRTFADLYYNFARQANNLGQKQTSTDMWSLGGRYERDFGLKSFWYTSARFERDGVNLLDLRSIAGAGIGYTLFSNEQSTWRLSGGLSYVNEDYRNGNNTFWGFQAQSDYNRELNGKLSLDHRFTFIPNLSDFGDHYFQSNLGLQYSLSNNLTAGLRYIIGFDSTPSANSVKQNTTWAFLLGYKF